MLWRKSHQYFPVNEFRVVYHSLATAKRENCMVPQTEVSQHWRRARGNEGPDQVPAANRLISEGMRDTAIQHISKGLQSAACS